MPAVAYKMNDWLSIGAGLNVMYAMFEQKAKINNAIDILPDGELKIKDEAFAYGANIGVLIEASERTRFGIQYLSEMSLDFKDRPEFSNLGPGLSAILGRADKLELGMTAPDSVMVSAYHELTEKLAIMGNLGWQQWSEFGKVDVTVSSDTSSSLTADRSYDDTWHVAVGAQYRISEPWLWSLGIAYDSSIVEDKDRTPDLPLGEAWRFGTGIQYKWKKNLDVSLAYELLWAGDLPMDVERGPLAGRVSGDFNDVNMHFINLALNWRF
jgi:long-chain fatty acid transport protein